MYDHIAEMGGIIYEISNFIADIKRKYKDLPDDIGEIFHNTVVAQFNFDCQIIQQPLSSFEQAVINSIRRGNKNVI